MRGNERDPGRIIKVVGGFALSLAFLAADRGAVTPTTNQASAFDTSPSLPAAVDVLKTPELSPNTIVLPAKVPETTLAAPAIYTGCDYCLWVPDFPPPNPNYPNLQNRTQIKVLDCSQELPDDTEIFSECGGPNHIVILGHAYKALKQLRDAYWQGYLTKDNKDVKDVKDVILYYTNGSGQLFAYKLVQVERLTVDELNKRWPLGDTLTRTITLITCDNGDDGSVDTKRLVADFEQLEQIPFQSVPQFPLLKN